MLESLIALMGQKITFLSRLLQDEVECVLSNRLMSHEPRISRTVLVAHLRLLLT